ncbi:Histone deacetylase 6 [Geodia barretti]|uniref:Histone deacetylase 6 n=1 Tax=Geodia barretti TaxID=519541 RepID=A0AA35RDF7_GEOBA|nr:Histone deacetylase 6 [Geodia barretti]
MEDCLQGSEGSSGLGDRPFASKAHEPCSKPGLLYDARMREHENEGNPSHPESPDRISRIWSLLRERGLVERCCLVEAREATKEEILKIHSEEHYVTMETTREKSTEELREMARDYNSVYLHKLIFPCALLAAGSVIEMTEKVLQGKLPSGVTVVRPPGHHAVTEKCMGFCIFNSVAIAAKVAIDNHNISRILIVDWDVHHGNATQEQFYDDKRVLYFSLHRYDNAMFYPKSTAAGPTHMGGVSAKGYNVNMAWSGKMMGDPEYLAAFHHLLLPIASEFNPELVLVSCGLDAAKDDPLGRYHVSPVGYAHMTHLLRGLAGGKMVVAHEGGYNLKSISESMAAIVSVLLGDPLPCLPDKMVPNDDAVDCIRAVVSAQIPYWKSLRIFGSVGAKEMQYFDNSPDFEEPESHDQTQESRDRSGDVGGASGGNEDIGDSLLSNLREMAIGETMMFAVTPKSDCEHLTTLSPKPLPPDIASHRSILLSNYKKWI